MKEDTIEIFLYVCGFVAAFILILLIWPFILFWIGYLCGWMAKITIGSKICSALNMLFNITYFTPDKLPLISAALTWLGSFFYTPRLNLGKKKKSI